MFECYKKLIFTGVTHFVPGETASANELPDANQNGTNVDEALANIMQDGKLDAKDKAIVETLIQDFEDDKNNIFNDTKEAVKDAVSSMMEDGYTISTSQDYDVLKNILTLSGVKLPDYSTLVKNGLPELTDRSFSMISDGEGGFNIFVRSAFYNTDHTDMYGPARSPSAKNRGSDLPFMNKNIDMHINAQGDINTDLGYWERQSIDRLGNNNEIDLSAASEALKEDARIGKLVEALKAETTEVKQELEKSLKFQENIQQELDRNRDLISDLYQKLQDAVDSKNQELIQALKSNIEDNQAYRRELMDSFTECLAAIEKNRIPLEKQREPIQQIQDLVQANEQIVHVNIDGEKVPRDDLVQQLADMQEQIDSLMQECDDCMTEAETIELTSQDDFLTDLLENLDDVSETTENMTLDERASDDNNSKMDNISETTQQAPKLADVKAWYKKQGATEDHIKNLQLKLDMRGDDVDGKIGQNTLKAIIDFQDSKDELDSDGLVGDETLKALGLGSKTEFYKKLSNNLIEEKNSKDIAKEKFQSNSDALHTEAFKTRDFSQVISFMDNMNQQDWDLYINNSKNIEEFGVMLSSLKEQLKNEVGEISTDVSPFINDTMQIFSDLQADMQDGDISKRDMKKVYQAMENAFKSIPDDHYAIMLKMMGWDSLSSDTEIEKTTIMDNNSIDHLDNVALHTILEEVATNGGEKNLYGFTNREGNDVLFKVVKNNKNQVWLKLDTPSMLDGKGKGDGIADRSKMLGGATDKIDIKDVTVLMKQWIEDYRKKDSKIQDRADARRDKREAKKSEKEQSRQAREDKKLNEISTETGMTIDDIKELKENKIGVKKRSDNTIELNIRGRNDIIFNMEKGTISDERNVLGEIKLKPGVSLVDTIQAVANGIKDNKRLKLDTEQATQRIQDMIDRS